ncbi:hypothetical protein DFJ73DRAFT_860877 [Zopfochytrium polystomum]|nr:hypothetical protein DFJ73DRAFT_860877 [Zopfochytrium polystomum]
MHAAAAWTAGDGGGAGGAAAAAGTGCLRTCYSVPVQTRPQGPVRAEATAVAKMLPTPQSPLPLKPPIMKTLGFGTRICSAEVGGGRFRTPSPTLGPLLLPAVRRCPRPGIARAIAGNCADLWDGCHLGEDERVDAVGCVDGDGFVAAVVAGAGEERDSLGAAGPALASDSKPRRRHRRHRRWIR